MTQKTTPQEIKQVRIRFMTDIISAKRAEIDHLARRSAMTGKSPIGLIGTSNPIKPLLDEIQTASDIIELISKT